MSFGIIAVKYVEGKPCFLMIRRRDSMCFVEFLRGKYKMTNREYIQLLLNGMTAEEHKRLVSAPFDKLWENLWNSQNTRQYRNEYELAKHTFDTLKNVGDIYGNLMTKYIADVTTTWAEPEWGFPKGRRSLHETDVTCALREFGEETALPTSTIRVLQSHPQYLEAYTGSNGIPYKQVYYLAAAKSDVGAHMERTNRLMAREVGDIRWVTVEEARVLIRPTSPDKLRLLEAVFTEVSKPTVRGDLEAAFEWTSA